MGFEPVLVNIGTPRTDTSDIRGAFNDLSRQMQLQIENSRNNREEALRTRIANANIDAETNRAAREAMLFNQNQNTNKVAGLMTQAANIDELNNIKNQLGTEANVDYNTINSRFGDKSTELFLRDSGGITDSLEQNKILEAYKGVYVDPKAKALFTENMLDNAVGRAYSDVISGGVTTDTNKAAKDVNAAFSKWLKSTGGEGDFNETVIGKGYRNLNLLDGKGRAKLEEALFKHKVDKTQLNTALLNQQSIKQSMNNSKLQNNILQLELNEKLGEKKVINNAGFDTKAQYTAAITKNNAISDAKEMRKLYPELFAGIDINKTSATNLEKLVTQANAKLADDNKFMKEFVPASSWHIANEVDGSTFNRYTERLKANGIPIPIIAKLVRQLQADNGTFTNNAGIIDEYSMKNNSNALLNSFHQTKNKDYFAD